MYLLFSIWIINDVIGEKVMLEEHLTGCCSKKKKGYNSVVIELKLIFYMYCNKSTYVNSTRKLKSLYGLRMGSS